VHEDVQIRLFCFSLEGIAHGWYQYLPIASISSLADFHAAFHVFCKGIFRADLLYPQCCHEFQLLTKELNAQEKYVAVEDTLHYDQEISDSPHDNLSNAFDNLSNSSTVVRCHNDHIFLSENLEDIEKINKTTSDSFISAEDEEDNLQFPDLQGLSNIQLKHENHDQECVDAVIDTSHGSLDPNNSEDLNPRFESTTYVMGSPHFLDLQTKADCITCEESNGKEEQKVSDQKFILYFLPAEIKQSTFGTEFCEGKEEQLQHSQLEQQSKEVLFYDFEDPIVDFLDSISSIDVKIFMSEEDYLHHPLKPLFYMIWPSLLFQDLA
jgi:hypothetical protein